MESCGLEMDHATFKTEFINVLPKRTQRQFIPENPLTRRINTPTRQLDCRGIPRNNIPGWKDPRCLEAAFFLGWISLSMPIVVKAVHENPTNNFPRKSRPIQINWLIYAIIIIIHGWLASASALAVHCLFCLEEIALSNWPCSFTIKPTMDISKLSCQEITPSCRRLWPSSVFIPRKIKNEVAGYFFMISMVRMIRILFFILFNTCHW